MTDQWRSAGLRTKKRSASLSDGGFCRDRSAALMVNGESLAIRWLPAIVAMLSEFLQSTRAQGGGGHPPLFTRRLARN
jgi:hypothetical protein